MGLFCLCLGRCHSQTSLPLSCRVCADGLTRFCSPVRFSHVPIGPPRPRAMCGLAAVRASFNWKSHRSPDTCAAVLHYTLYTAVSHCMLHLHVKEDTAAQSQRNKCSYGITECTHQQRWNKRQRPALGRGHARSSRRSAHLADAARSGHALGLLAEHAVLCNLMIQLKSDAIPAISLRHWCASAVRPWR